MVIDMNETKFDTIAQLQDFLKATPEVSFGGIGEKDGSERYEHISRVLKRFDYPHRKRAERGEAWCSPTCSAPVVTAEPR